MSIHLMKMRYNNRFLCIYLVIFLFSIYTNKLITSIHPSNKNFFMYFKVVSPVKYQMSEIVISSGCFIKKTT